ANVTGNSGLFMCVRLAEVSSYSAARILNTKNLSPVVGHGRVNSTWTANLKPCYRLCSQVTMNCKPRRLHETKSPFSVRYGVRSPADRGALLLLAVRE